EHRDVEGRDAAGLPLRAQGLAADHARPPAPRSRGDGPALLRARGAPRRALRAGPVPDAAVAQARRRAPRDVPRFAAARASLLAAVGFIAVLARAISDAVGPDGATPFVVVASFGVYVVTAELVLGRARSNRGPRTRAASGIAQWAPVFLWVPYAVVAYHVGPELAAPTPVFAAGIALTVLGIVFALWALATIGRHF